MLRMRRPWGNSSGVSAPGAAVFSSFARLSATVSVNVIPPPRCWLAVMSPPMARANCLTDDNPRPAPPKREAMLTFACENGLNSRLISASDNPMPLSDTANTTAELASGTGRNRDIQRDLALRRELDGVVDQVFQRCPQANRIADHERR